MPLILPPHKGPLFWAKVAPPNEGGCRLWTGTKSAIHGYGYFGISTGRATTAHRVAYLLAKGEIPEGLDVCHACDVRLCCNPDHLFLGTRKENMEDCKRKGRNPHGSKHPASILTDDIVMRMRDEARRGESLDEISERYSVSRQQCWQVVAGRRWKHLPVYWKPQRNRK